METKHDFTQGNILKKLVLFMVPIFGALVLQAMYGAVDLIIVGWFGTTAGISAVSTGSNLVNLVVFTVTGLSMGITVLISRYIGEKKQERIGKVIGGVIWFFAILAVILTIALLLAAPVLAKLMQAPEEALELTTLYVRICGGGIVFVIAYNVISSIFRGMGNSKLPLIFVAIACVVNIVGDLVLVAGFKMNVAGAAIATIRKQGGIFQVKREDIRFSSEVKKFLMLGAPIALQEMLTNISFLILCALINRLGLEASSGYGVAQKIVSFVMLVPSSLMQSMSSVVGQNIGAGKEKRARQAMVCGMCVGAAVGTAVALFVFFRGSLPAAIFTSDEPVIGRAAEYLRGFAPEAVLTSFLFSYMGYFNGKGKTLFVMAQGLAQTFLVRIPMSYFMSIQPDASLTKIGLAAPTATVFGIILCSIYFVVLGRKEKNESDKFFK